MNVDDTDPGGFRAADEAIRKAIMAIAEAMAKYTDSKIMDNKNETTPYEGGCSCNSLDGRSSPRARTC